MVAIGVVTKQKDGSYRGHLATLTIKTNLEIRPNRDKKGKKPPDYRIYAENIEIGLAWNKVGEESGRKYVAVAIAMPEFGPKYLSANLAPIPSQPNKHTLALIWDPE
jgi:uncharacterized protein (DUF736 family)